MSHGLFYQCIYYVSGPGYISVALLSMEGSESSPISSKIYIYIYAFNRRFYPKRLTVHLGYTFLSVCVFPEN